jgi:hypothetical protein
MLEKENEFNQSVLSISRKTSLPTTLPDPTGDIKKMADAITNAKRPKQLVIEKLLSNLLSLLIRTPTPHGALEEITILLKWIRKKLLILIGVDDDNCTSECTPSSLVFPSIRKRMSRAVTRDTVMLIVATQLNTLTYFENITRTITEVVCLST